MNLRVVPCPVDLGKMICAGRGGLPWGTMVQASFQNLHLLPTRQVLSLVPLQKVTPSPRSPKPQSTKSGLLTPGHWQGLSPGEKMGLLGSKQTLRPWPGPGAATPCTQFGGGLGG